MDEAQALTGRATDKRLRQAFKYMREKYGIRPSEVDAYAINFNPRLIPIGVKRVLFPEFQRISG